MNYANAIKTAIVKLYRNRNKYLFYNMIKMLIYIFALLFIIFLFIPHKAYIVLESNDINTLNIKSNKNENCYIQSNNLSRLDIQLMNNGKFALNLYNVTIENADTIYTGNFEIIFEPIKQNFNNSYQVHFEPINNTYLNAEIFNLENLEFSHQETFKTGLISEPIVKSIAGLTTYLTTNGDVIINNSFSIVIPDKEYMYAYIVNKDNERIPLEEKCCIFLNNSNANIDFLQGKFGIMMWHSVNGESNFSVSSICDININCNGDLYFSYIPESTKYKIYFQDIKLHSKDDNIKCEYVFDLETNKQQILINGNINKAYLSDNNLFPNLIGWFKSNIYMIPLTLVSAVIGGLSLTYKK